VNATAAISTVKPPLFIMGGKPSFLWHTDVPLFIPNQHLMNRAGLPGGTGRVWIDSGGFSELQINGRWTRTPKQYVGDLRWYRDHFGDRLMWAAQQDWMCEDAIIHGGTFGKLRFAGTGLSKREHQHRTVGNYLDLMSLDDTLDIIPVVQGRTPADYEYCIDLFDRAGIDLLKQPTVGVGSVCRIQGTDEAADIVEHVASILGPNRIHGFGFKIEGLRKVAHLGQSFDSHAWSLDGRHEPGCDFRLPRSRKPHKTEANCLRYALWWRKTKALPAALYGATAPRQLRFDFGTAA
jgi:hypothetical protein